MAKDEMRCPCPEGLARTLGGQPHPRRSTEIRIDKVLHFQVRDQPFDIFKSGKIKHICFKINRLILNDHTLNDMFQVHQSLNTSLFKNTNYVHFVVGSENFQVHVDMLSLKSDVFRAMFDHNMTEKNSKIIKIEDFEAEVVEEMIKFIYTNELSETIDHPQDLYAIAHKYQIDNLQAKCIEYLIFNLNFCNAASLYKFAKLYDIDGLIQTLNSFFKKYVKNMVKEETYRSYLCENINSENLKDILFLCAEFNESLGDVQKTAFTFIKNNISTVIDQLILVDWFKKHGTFAYELFKFINYQDSQD
ncbi:kelch-like protein 26 [Trichogramma pretiosum]|uniref:kelch-like protein 26 n=1 Tax=Trichogramma pretiosum TaxID=7493 RepID=UPI0006C95726|nr:kelch-like protein 26 [Trichogramma pretiosum]